MENRFGRFGYGDCSGVPYPYWPTYPSSPSAQPSTSAAMFPPGHPLEFHHPTEGLPDSRVSWAFYQHLSPDWSLRDDYYHTMPSSSHNAHGYQSGNGGFNSVAHHLSNWEKNQVNCVATSSSSEVNSPVPLSKPMEPSSFNVSSNGYEQTWGTLHSANNGKPEISKIDLNLDPSKCVTNGHGNGNHTGIQKRDGKSLLSNKDVANYNTPEHLLGVFHSNLNGSSNDVLPGDHSFVNRPQKLNFGVDLNRKECGSSSGNSENDVSKEQKLDMLNKDKKAPLLADNGLKKDRSDTVNKSSLKISAVVEGIHNLSEVLVHECFNNGNFLKLEQFESLEKVVGNIRNCLKRINVKPLPEDCSNLEEVMHKNEMTQSIKNVLVSKFPDDKEVENPRTQMFKHLWLEAEAALCSTTLISRYHLIKNEHEDHKLVDKEISVETKNGEKNVVEATSQESPRSSKSNLDSVNFITAGLASDSDSDTESETYTESEEDSNNEGSESNVRTETCTDLDSPTSSWEHL